ncbi:MAG: CopG family ribbon-helix-helix protein [archaeon]|nr:CopG family ribbon-helix-helix protein [archaeon]
MPIISVSLDAELCREIGALQKEFGYSGRSEAVRAGLRLLANEAKQRSSLKGKIDALLVLVHSSHADEVSRIRHHYNDSIKAQLHNHLSSGKCLEIFVLRAKADVLKAMADAFDSNKKIEFVRLIVT